MSAERDYRRAYLRHIRVLSRAAAVLLGALLVLAVQLHAQSAQPRLLIYADTAAAHADGPGTYTTWVYAKAGPNTFPSSGVEVAFDCVHRQVRRLSKVVYGWNADSTGVDGPILPDTTDWMPPHYPKLLEMVCLAGQDHS